jgi:hypothetical protein
MLEVALDNAVAADYTALVAFIEGLYPGGTDDSSLSYLGMYMYDHTYTYSGATFDLDLILYSGTLSLEITDQSGGGTPPWPGSQWAAFNLSGLTRPTSTVIDDVVEMTSSVQTILSVTLNNVNDTAYNDLLTQIGTLLGVAPYPGSTIGSNGSPIREDMFMASSGTSTIIVDLSMDTVADEISIAVGKT